MLDFFKQKLNDKFIRGHVIGNQGKCGRSDFSGGHDFFVGGGDGMVSSVVVVKME